MNFELSSGALVDLEHPEASAFTVEALSLGLSRIPRFAGQTRRFLSVAQHSVAVSLDVPLGFELAGLLHDAHELLTGDIPTPSKALLGAKVPRLAARLDRVIGYAFNCDPALFTSDEVKAAAARALAREAVLLSSRGENIVGERATTGLRCWPPELAEHRFLDRFTTLAGAMT